MSTTINDNIPVVINNVHYGSLIEAATQNNVYKKDLVEGLLHYGNNCPNIFKKLKLKKNVRPIMINGIYYKSIKQAAETHNIKKDQLLKNLKTYGTKTNLVFEFKKSSDKYNLPVVLTGKKFDSLSMACRKNYMSLFQLAANLRKFGDNDKQIWYPDYRLQSQHITVAGLTFGSKRVINFAFLIKPAILTGSNHILNKRIEKYGLDDKHCLIGENQDVSYLLNLNIQDLMNTLHLSCIQAQDLKNYFSKVKTLDLNELYIAYKEVGTFN